MAKLDASLQAIVGNALPELEALTAAQQKQLVQDLEHAHQKHDAFLKESMDNALEHIPRLLRGAVKKILGL